MCVLVEVPFAYMYEYLYVCVSMYVRACVRAMWDGFFVCMCLCVTCP
jgi:hypothetical protein